MSFVSSMSSMSSMSSIFLTSLSLCRFRKCSGGMKILDMLDIMDTLDGSSLWRSSH
jgi:hypothetical protein